MADYCHCISKSNTIPQRDNPILENLAKQCESCRPMSMFHSSDAGSFLLHYDGLSMLLSPPICF